MRFELNQSNKRSAVKVGRVAVAGVLCASLAGFGVAPAVSYAVTNNSGTEFAQDQETVVKPDDSTDSSDDTNTGDIAKPDNSDSNKKNDTKKDTGKKAQSQNSKSKTAELKKQTKEQKTKDLKKKAEEKAKVATAKEAIAEMETLAAQLETAYEDLAQQKVKLKKLKKQIKKNKADIENVKENLATAKAKVSEYARETYVNGSVRYLSVLLGATDFGDFVDRFQFMTLITKNGEEAVKQVQELQKNLDEENQKLTDAYAEKKELTAKAEQNATTVSNALIEQTDYFGALPAKIRKAVLKNGSVPASVAKAFKNIGSTSTDGSHPEVAKMALKYLGVKYVWGGETPSGFDCSGLVMYCYQKAAGISLTHFARTQYSEGKKIAKEALMPGDLVFFGPSIEGIHHVGIYLGDDKFIHAPHTGDVVKISELSSRSDFIGACRP